MCRVIGLLLFAALAACGVAAPVVDAATDGATSQSTSEATETATEAATEFGPFPSDKTPLMTTQSDGGLDLSLWLEGESPARGTNVAWLRVEEGGQPVDGLELAVVPLMPSMGHGTHVTPVVSGLGQGRYHVADVVFSMAGAWELRIKISGSRTDEAVFALQVP